MRKPKPGQWSESEVARLKALARTMPVRDIVTELQRSRGAITAKAFSLRLSVDYHVQRSGQGKRNLAS